MELVRYMISDAAKKIDVEPYVLRYWEEELAVEIPRNEMGHRYYRDEEINTMKGVKYLKEKGFQLKSIKILLPDIKKVMLLEQRRLLELRDKLELAVSQEELRLQREEELKRCEQALRRQDEPEWKKKEMPEGQEEGMPQQEEKPEWQERETQRAQLKWQEEETLRGQEEGMPQQEKKPEWQERETQRAQEVPDFGETDEKNRKEEEKDGENVSGELSIKDTGKEMAQNYSVEEAEQSMERMRRFRSIMNGILSDAMLENNRKLTAEITESVSKEMEYHMKKKEMQEEEHFKQLDRLLREYQQGLKQTAVTREYKQSKFFKKHKVRI